MLPRTGTDAADWAAGQVKHPSKNWFDLCLQFTRSCHKVPAKYGRADIALQHVKKMHHGTPPVGVPVWFRENHVVESAGGGYCYSTDILEHGKISKVPISLIVAKWNMTLEGWSEDINEVDVYPNVPPLVQKTVSLKVIQDAARRDRHRPQGAGLHASTTKLVERALAKEGLLKSAYANDGYYGSLTLTAYSKWQRRAKVGGPYDGIPGVKSLTMLGNRYGFKVKP